MNYRKVLTLMLLFVSYISHGFAEKYDTLYVSDFGIMPKSRENATLVMKKILLKAREVHNPLILFEKGRYDFWPQYCEERDYYESNTTDINPKRLAILIEEFEKLIIDGNGADFVFHDRMQPITLDHSKNIKIENVEIYHTAGLGILSQFSENISMDHV